MWSQEMILNKGDLAPFRGVLVPERPNYFEYQKAYEMRMIVDPTINPQYHDECEQGWDTRDLLWASLASLLVGVVAGNNLK